MCVSEHFVVCVNERPRQERRYMRGVVRHPLIQRGSSFFLLRDLGFMIKTFLPGFSEEGFKPQAHVSVKCFGNCGEAI